MTVRSAASRLVTLATLVAIATALVGTTTAQARSGAAGARPAWHAQDHGRGASGASSARQVDVHRLPAAKGTASPQNPHLAAPAGQFRTAAPTGTSVAVAPTFATTNTDPAIGEAKSFAGLAQTTGALTSGEPPDPWVAAGPEHVAQVVNTAFRFTNRSGGGASVVDMFDFFGLDQFYSPGEVAFFDPHIIYDSLHQRWISIEASFDCFPVTGFSTVGTGYVDIAISSGPNPTGTWFVDSISFADALPDYPGIGTSTDKVVVSSNVFELVPGGGMGCEPSQAGDAFLGTEMDVMAWSELLANKVDPDFLYSPNNFPNNYFSWRPSLQTPASTPTVLAVALTTSNGAIAYARITGSPAGSGTVSISISSLASLVTGFSNPPPPQQPGAPATIDEAVDARPTDAIFKDNRLALVSTATCDPAGGVAEQRDCVRVTELNTTNQATPTLIQTFFVGEEGADLYMGGIGYASNDDLHVVYTRSSAAAGQYPSSYAAYQSAGAANNTLSARALLSAGTGTYPGHRWGDYVGVAQDPQVPNAVWQANEFSAGADFWATEVSQLQTGGSSYVPITPVRVLDTRPGPNNVGLSGVFTANLPRTFGVAGQFGIPANAVAVTGNVTVVGQTAAGFVAITPTPVANPTSSTLNFPLGDTRANNFTTPLSGSGKLAALYKSSAGKSTHLLVDITGYFLAGNTHATYATLTPVRILDSRPTSPIGPSGAFHPSAPRQVHVAGGNGIPPDAIAITANLTVTGQTQPGFLSVTPNSVTNPSTSTLNFPLGDTRANGASLPLNGTGDLYIVYNTSSGTGTTHVLLDVTGYYRNVSTGLKFFPLTPGRIMDTRPGVQLSGLSGTFKTSTPRQLPTAGHWGVPSTANAITGNLTVVNQTASGFVSATLTSIANPPVSVLNFPLNDIRANGATLPLNGSGGAFFVYNSSLAGKSTNLILDVSGYFD